jgi:hypothetical protein
MKLSHFVYRRAILNVVYKYTSHLKLIDSKSFESLLVATHIYARSLTRGSLISLSKPALYKKYNYLVLSLCSFTNFGHRNDKRGNVRVT